MYGDIGRHAQACGPAPRAGHGHPSHGRPPRGPDRGHRLDRSRRRRHARAGPRPGGPPARGCAASPRHAPPTPSNATSHEVDVFKDADRRTSERKADDARRRRPRPRRPGRRRRRPRRRRPHPRPTRTSTLAAFTPPPSGHKDWLTVTSRDSDMPTIDLSTPPPPPAGLLDGAAAPGGPDPARAAAGRRARRRRPAAVRAVRARPARTRSRAGSARAAPPPRTRRTPTPLASLHDPASSLGAPRAARRRTPRTTAWSARSGCSPPRSTAVDIDVTAAGVRARSWHRQSGDAVATPVHRRRRSSSSWPGSTPRQWPGELGRVGVLPEDLPAARLGGAGVRRPPLRAGRRRQPRRPAAAAPTWSRCSPRSTRATVLDADGRPLTELRRRRRAARALRSSRRAGCGRWSPTCPATQTTVVGVVSWTLLADGWHALRPRDAGGDAPGRTSAASTRPTSPPSSRRSSRR